MIVMINGASLSALMGLLTTHALAPVPTTPVSTILMVDRTFNRWKRSITRQGNGDDRKYQENYGLMLRQQQGVQQQGYGRASRRQVRRQQRIPQQGFGAMSPRQRVQQQRYPQMPPEQRMPRNQGILQGGYAQMSPQQNRRQLGYVQTSRRQEMRQQGYGRVTAFPREFGTGMLQQRYGLMPQRMRKQSYTQYGRRLSRAEKKAARRAESGDALWSGAEWAAESERFDFPNPQRRRGKVPAAITLWAAFWAMYYYLVVSNGGGLSFPFAI